MNSQDKFRTLTFEGFRQLAQDDSLSRYEKIGFPDAYREGKEESIFRDITQKLSNLGRREQAVMDIGPGCSDLAFMLIDLCRRQGHTLILVDSGEMLAHLPNESFIVKVPAYYPNECAWLFEKYARQINVILTYSVLHYIFVEGNLFDFLDRSLGLLADGGEMLIGDIPNLSKRRRFFASPNGIAFHRHFTGTNEIPQVDFNALEPNQIDDAVFLAIISRCRNAGFDAYWLPQADDVPMANRREDVLIKKP
jgi:hypothetical protein